MGAESPDVEPPWQSPVVTPDRHKAAPPSPRPGSPMASPNAGLMNIYASVVQSDEADRKSPSRSPVPALDLTRLGGAAVQPMKVAQPKKAVQPKKAAYPPMGGERTIVTRKQALAQVQKEREVRGRSPSPNASPPAPQPAVVVRRSTRSGTTGPRATIPARGVTPPRPARSVTASPARSVTASPARSAVSPDVRQPTPASATRRPPPSPEEKAAMLLDESDESDWVPNRPSASARPPRPAAPPPKERDPVEDLLEDLDASEASELAVVPDQTGRKSAPGSAVKKSPRDMAEELLSDLEASSEDDSGKGRKRRVYSPAKVHEGRPLRAIEPSQVPVKTVPDKTPAKLPPKAQKVTPRTTPHDMATELFEELDASDDSSDHHDALSTRSAASDKSALDLVLA